MFVLLLIVRVSAHRQARRQNNRVVVSHQHVVPIASHSTLTQPRYDDPPRLVGPVARAQGTIDVRDIALPGYDEPVAPMPPSYWTVLKVCNLRAVTDHV